MMSKTGTQGQNWVGIDSLHFLKSHRRAHTRNLRRALTVTCGRMLSTLIIKFVMRFRRFTSKNIEVLRLFVTRTASFQLFRKLH